MPSRRELSKHNIRRRFVTFIYYNKNISAYTVIKRARDIHQKSFVAVRAIAPPRSDCYYNNTRRQTRTRSK